ncbi:hypothetical protein LRC39_04720 [Rhodopseudomonas sp. P1]|uniref:P-loop ATPase, Sll1717 family n=1 Tax=Rhodopseudomonas TaxID=1073 RepID=UPI000E5B862C|nr:hypothetical protein [Rhodopseudomonas palustris]QLH70082.1 hypothetical protein HZF03_04505 [Rhodopseudomonas palustris]RHZ97968.1 hypothetical protein D1920_16565 [Rhodopseudomonas palustris]
MPNFDDQTIEVLFGADDAENEEPARFLAYFYFNRAYDSLVANLPIRILVGHKGVGKSALLRRAYLDDCEKKHPSIWIQSSDLSPIKDRVSAATEFSGRIEAWKREILIFLTTATVEQVFGQSPEENRTKIAAGSTQSLVKLLGKTLEEGERRGYRAAAINLYIDDIDRGWAAQQKDISNISALLNAMRDIAGIDRRIRFRIGLRSDVYFLVRTSDESTDKIERNVIWLRWNNDEILRLAAKRIETFFGGTPSNEDLAKIQQSQISQTVLSKVIDPTFRGLGHWSKRPIHVILTSLTRARPRDLVKLFQGAAKKAHAKNHQIISSEDLESSFQAYSQDRLQDVINEFRSELPEIEKLLLHMRPTKKQRRTAESYQFTTDQLSVKLQEIMGHVSLRFTNGRYVTPRSLIQFLYKIDFITARKEDLAGKIDRKYFDESRFLASEIVEFGYDWEIHPAYRWALQPQDIQDVIDSLRG